MMESQFPPTKHDSSESDLFIASKLESLDDFLKTDIAKGKHVYCSFKRECVDPLLWRLLNEKKVESISFCDGHTSYPASELKKTLVTFVARAI